MYQTLQQYLQLCNLVDLGDWLGCGICVGVGSIQCRHIRQQKQPICLHQCCHLYHNRKHSKSHDEADKASTSVAAAQPRHPYLCCQRVIVAKPYLLHSHRVILIHDGDRAISKQLRKGVARIEVLGPDAQVVLRQQNLRAGLRSSSSMGSICQPTARGSTCMGVCLELP